MPTISLLQAERAILESAITAPGQPIKKVHKYNLIGRPYQQGELEMSLGVVFGNDDRAVSERAFDELMRDGFLQSTYVELIEPENWVAISDIGRHHLQNDLKDDIDLCLESLGSHLPELRRGMWDAVERTSPDAGRQAAQSARELIVQALKAASPPDCATRKARVAHILKKRDATAKASQSDLRIVEACCELVEAEHDKLAKNAHLRGVPDKGEVRGSVEAAERILRLLFQRASVG